MKSREQKQIAFAYFVLLALLLNLAIGCVNIAQGTAYRATLNDIGNRIEELRSVLMKHGLMEPK